MSDETQEQVAATLKSALEIARSKLDELLRERQRIDRHIIGFQRTVDSLAEVLERSHEADLPPDVAPSGLEVPVGFTDAVRQVLRESGNPMGPRAVRDALVASGIDMSKYSSPMVPVHNTLKRLCNKGEVTRTPAGETGAFQYAWVGPVGRALALEKVPRQFGPNRNAIANLTNEKMAEMAKPKRQP